MTRDRGARVGHWLKDQAEILRQRGVDLVYASPLMGEVIESITRVAETDATVLITGESGSGKGILARVIHQLSGRSGQAFVVVDCGAIAVNLIDSELFGHEKGAFTGSGSGRVGRLAQGDRGTVFIDEVGELPLETQSKLLRFAEEKRLTPVGGSRPRAVDARILAATNRALEEEVGAKRFRQDLYHRLNVFPIVVPPLRARPEDILVLARHFLRKHAQEYQRQVLELTSAADEALLGYPWPGNVRELSHCILKAVLLSDRPELGPQELRLPRRPNLPRRRAVRWIHKPARSARVCSENSLPRTDEDQTPQRLWDSLDIELGNQIDQVCASGAPTPGPLGRWLDQDLVIEAFRIAEGCLSKGASLLRLPESTFRLRLRKAESLVANELAPRPSGWWRIQEVLGRLVSCEAPTDVDLSRQVRERLLSLVVSKTSLDDSLGSAVMGVTLRTYRKWRTEMERRSEPHRGGSLLAFPRAR